MYKTILYFCVLWKMNYIYVLEYIFYTFLVRYVRVKGTNLVHEILNSILA